MGESEKKSVNTDDKEQTESSFNNWEHLSSYQTEESQDEVENREQLKSSHIFKTKLKTISGDSFYDDLRNMIKEEEFSKTSTLTAQPFVLKEAAVSNSLPKSHPVQKTIVIAQNVQEADVERTSSRNNFGFKKEKSKMQKRLGVLISKRTVVITSIEVNKSKEKKRKADFWETRFKG